MDERKNRKVRELKRKKEMRKQRKKNKGGGAKRKEGKAKTYCKPRFHLLFQCFKP